MWFFSRKNNEELIAQGRNGFIQKLNKWHQKQDEDDAKRLKNFDVTKLESYVIHVWGEVDYYDYSCAYVENSEMPNRVKLQLLQYVESQIHQQNMLHGLNCDVELYFHDRSAQQPELIDGRYAGSMSKSWKLKISNIGSESLEKSLKVLVERMQNLKTFNGKPLLIFFLS